MFFQRLGSVKKHSGNTGHNRINMSKRFMPYWHWYTDDEYEGSLVFYIGNV